MRAGTGGNVLRAYAGDQPGRVLRRRHRDVLHPPGRRGGRASPPSTTCCARSSARTRPPARQPRRRAGECRSNVRRMRHQARADELARVPLFAGCSKRELKRLATEAHVEQIEPGEALVSQGAPSRQLYVVLAGSATIQRHGTVVDRVDEGRRRRRARPAHRRAPQRRRGRDVGAGGAQPRPGRPAAGPRRGARHGLDAPHRRRRAPPPRRDARLIPFCTERSAVPGRSLSAVRRVRRRLPPA